MPKFETEDKLYSVEISPTLSDNPSAIKAVIQTPKATLFSVNHYSRNQELDAENLCALYADETNMKTYADGKPRPAEVVISRYTDHVNRWNTGNPFSAFIIADKKDQFIGHCVFGGSGKPGIAEIAIVIDNHHWRQGYGTEAIMALTYGYGPLVAEEGYKLGDEPFTAIRSTAHPDNGTTKIFNKLGYKLEETIEHENYGATRNVFVYPIIKPELELKNEIESEESTKSKAAPRPGI